MVMKMMTTTTTTKTDSEVTDPLINWTITVLSVPMPQRVSLDELFSFNSGPDEISRAQAIGLRSRTRGAMKRHAISALSDGSSDHEGSVKKDRTVATKKRRIGISSTSDVVDDLDGPLNADHLSASAFRVLPSSARAKGKGRLVSQRELSHDSVSLTPASRRRRSAPRKRLDHLAPDRLDLLGLFHPGASASGEASPGFSRPASPATAMSFVYELDEPIPPLKRAKKIDDGAMLKRIKALEDTQRKVWVNIARRDVPKVRENHSQYALQLTFDTGLQVPCHGLSSQAGAAGADSKAGFYPGSQAIHEDDQGHQGHPGES